MRRLTLVTAVAVFVGLLAGCTPTPTPSATPSTSPSASPSASGSSSESASPTPTFTVPGCDGIYSPALTASLSSGSLVAQGDVSVVGGGGWGTFDPEIEAILAAISERVSCSWILPASESGLTTSVSVLDDASRTALLAALAADGFTETTNPDGELYSLTVVEEFITYTEVHLLAPGVWIGSAYAFGEAEPLTLDAAATVLP